MKTEAERLWPALFHGWIELLTLFLVLFVALTFWGWARNRGYRPAERSGTTPWLLLLISFALLLVLRALKDAGNVAFVVAAAVLIGGWAGKLIPQRELWIPAMLMVCLIASGFMLSALILAVVAFIVILLSSTRRS
jgi:hypothetical protein